MEAAHAAHLPRVRVGTWVEWGTVELHRLEEGSQETMGVVTVRRQEDEVESGPLRPCLHC